MKTDRRNFLRLLGSSALAPIAKKVQPVIDKARVVVAQRLIKILLPANGVYVPQITGVPMIDFFLSMDHSIQIMPCGCRCTPEGDLIEGCEEERRLKALMDEATKVFYEASNGHHTLSWQEYRRLRNATRSYIRHCRATLVTVGQPIPGVCNPRTGEEIRL